MTDDQLASDSPVKSQVVRVIDFLGHVVDDGRKAVRGLRSSTEEMQALDQAFSRIPRNLAFPVAADYRVTVKGIPRTLHPVIRDEVYCIGREAVTNAYRHSGATRIEVALEYGLHELRVLVRDNGQGIEPTVLHAGRDGHWGLSGMRERAQKIGAKLRICSNDTNGTEVDLRVPVRIAFKSWTSLNTSKWQARISTRNTDSTESEREERTG